MKAPRSVLAGLRNCHGEVSSRRWVGRDCTGNFIPNALGFLHADSSLSSPKSSQLWKGYVSVTDIASGQEVAGESHGGLSRTVKTWSHRNQVVGKTGNECRSHPWCEQ